MNFTTPAYIACPIARALEKILWRTEGAANQKWFVVRENQELTNKCGQRIYFKSFEAGQNRADGLNRNL